MSVVKNLFLNYSDFTVAIPELVILDKGVTALCGPSGAGKTTVMRALLGLEPAANMTWDFKGENLAQKAPAERNIGVVFQSLELFPHMTARENVLFAARARKMSKTEAERRLDELAKLLKAERFLDKKVSVLSGGEKQRVAIMRALVGSPRILFLDEPFTALDKNLRSEARKLLKNVITQQNIPVLLITHDDEDIRELANNVINLDNGRVQVT